MTTSLIESFIINKWKNTSTLKRKSETANVIVYYLKNINSFGIKLNFFSESTSVTQRNAKWQKVSNTYMKNVYEIKRPKTGITNETKEKK